MITSTPPQHSSTLAPKTKGKPFTVLCNAGILAIALIAAVSCSTKSADNSVTGAGPASPTVQSPAPPPTPVGPSSEISKDGTFIVNTDIVAGTYRTDGGPNCYWERDKDLTGGVDSILDNGLANGQQVVTILPTDAAFKTQNCGTWSLIP